VSTDASAVLGERARSCKKKSPNVNPEVSLMITQERCGAHIFVKQSALHGLARTPAQAVLTALCKNIQRAPAHPGSISGGMVSMHSPASETQQQTVLRTSI
jgi:hypothetical protein